MAMTGNKILGGADQPAGTPNLTHQPRHSKDKYERTLAKVILLDGTHVNPVLVKDGWCWWYRKYAPGDTSNAPRKT